MNRITGKIWKIESFTDTESNTSLDFPNSLYEFQESGTYVVYDENQNEHTASWEFLNDDYILIGSNTYKIKILTSKLLGLRYGNIEIFYVPAD